MSCLPLASGRPLLLSFVIGAIALAPSASQATSIPPETCHYAFQPAHQLLPPGGGVGTVTLQRSDVDCPILVETGPNWLVVETIGDELVFRFTANTGLVERSTVVRVGGAEHVVAQPPCTFAISESERTVSAPAMTHDLDLLTEEQCPWSVRSDSAWIRPVTPEGRGPTLLSMDVAANLGFARTGQVVVNDLPLILHQRSVGDGPDVDGDGVIDQLDNCPSLANTGQHDEDEDGIGDRCQVELHVRADSPDLVKLTSFTLGVALPLGAPLDLYTAEAGIDVDGWSCQVVLLSDQEIQLSCEKTGPSLGTQAEIARLVLRHHGDLLPDCAGLIVPASGTVLRDPAGFALRDVALSCEVRAGLLGDLHPRNGGDGERGLADLVQARRSRQDRTTLSSEESLRLDLHPGTRTCVRQPLGTDGWSRTGDGVVTDDDVDVLRDMLIGARTPVLGGCDAFEPVDPAWRKLPGDAAPVGAPDGKVDIADTVLALRMAVGLVEPDPSLNRALDVSPPLPGDPSTAIGDGRVEVGDVVMLLRAAVGLEPIHWREHELDIVIDWVEAPFVAALVEVTGMPPSVEIADFTLAPCVGLAAATSGFASGDDGWRSACVVDPALEQGGRSLGVLRYWSPAPMAVETLGLSVELLDEALLPLQADLRLEVPVVEEPEPDPENSETE